MKNNLVFPVFLFFLMSCSSSKSVVENTRAKLKNNYTFLITEISTDKTYGYSKRNPVKVGGADNSEGPMNERRFLNALMGPNGEEVSYFRAGSCCQFKTENGIMGIGLLDNYRVTWKGAKDTVSIYINMYDYDVLKAPVGFSIKK